VKVAPLLPSRDLLSSHSQITWTHTWGLAILGLDIVTFNIKNNSRKPQQKEPRLHRLLTGLLVIVC
jgi:hypothetical protein